MIAIAFVLWVVAVVFIIITLKNIIIRAVKTKRCTAVTNGKVTDIKEMVRRRNGVISREYLPTVVYTVEGTEYSRHFTKVYHADAYTIGQTVEILYNPNKPTEINKKGLSNKADIIMLCIGIVIGAIGIVLIIFK